MKSILILLATLFLISSINAQRDSNKYLRQKAPGTTPEIFAPGIVSTDEFEFSGTFSPDGNEYYFTRRPTYEGSANRIFETKLVNGKWSEPKIASFAQDIFEFEPMMTPSGNKIYFFSERNGDRDNRFDGDLWYVERLDNGWSDVKYISSIINKKYCMTLSSTQDETIYFTTAFDGKWGIYRSKIENGEYSEVEYLPKAINGTSGAHPFISPDERYLIFDAQPTGRGNSELFISFKKDDGTWTQAINMGESINETKTEFGASVSFDGKYLFFHRRVNGNGDIWWVDAKILAKFEPHE